MTVQIIMNHEILSWMFEIRIPRNFIFNDSSEVQLRSVSISKLGTWIDKQFLFACVVWIQAYSFDSYTFTRSSQSQSFGLNTEHVRFFFIILRFGIVVYIMGSSSWIESNFNIPRDLDMNLSRGF